MEGSLRTPQCFYSPDNLGRVVLKGSVQIFFKWGRLWCLEWEPGPHMLGKRVPCDRPLAQALILFKRLSSHSACSSHTSCQ